MLDKDRPLQTRITEPNVWGLAHRGYHADGSEVSSPNLAMLRCVIPMNEAARGWFGRPLPRPEVRRIVFHQRRTQESKMREGPSRSGYNNQNFILILPTNYKYNHNLSYIPNAEPSGNGLSGSIVDQLVQRRWICLGTLQLRKFYFKAHYILTLEIYETRSLQLRPPHADFTRA